MGLVCSSKGIGVLLPELKVAPALQQLFERHGVKGAGELAMGHSDGPADELNGWLTSARVEEVLDAGQLSA